MNLYIEEIHYNGKVYSQEHGSPFDRGTADSYYDRPRKPHKRLTPFEWCYDLTEEEISAYNAGYDYNEEIGCKKEWE